MSKYVCLVSQKKLQRNKQAVPIKSYLNKKYCSIKKFSIFNNLSSRARLRYLLQLEMLFQIVMRTKWILKYETDFLCFFNISMSVLSVIRPSNLVIHVHPLLYENFSSKCASVEKIGENEEYINWEYYSHENKFHFRHIFVTTF